MRSRSFFSNLPSLFVPLIVMSAPGATTPLKYLSSSSSTTKLALAAPLYRNVRVVSPPLHSIQTWTVQT
jgi:hypothetical protein